MGGGKGEEATALELGAGVRRRKGQIRSKAVLGPREPGNNAEIGGQNAPKSQELGRCIPLAGACFIPGKMNLARGIN